MTATCASASAIVWARWASCSMMRRTDGTRGVEKCLSAQESKVAVWLIPTNEELMIARDAYQFVTEKA